MGYLRNDLPDTLAACTATFTVQPIPKEVQASLTESADVLLATDPTDELEETKDLDNWGSLYLASGIHSTEELFYGPQNLEQVAESYQKVSDLKIEDSLLEAAMPAKERNKLDNSEFGLPRLRKYPLHDRKHVLQAIRMFGHVKIEQDRKTLAVAIVKKYDEFKMTTKIGKNNPLYEYVPDRMKMGSISEGSAITVYGFEKKHALRNKHDIVMEHLRVNNAFYNNLFYTPEYAEALKKVNPERTKYLDYFYPSFKIHTYQTRLKTSLGGLYESLREMNSESLDELLNDSEKMKEFININYYTQGNWYRAKADDPTHVIYCFKLYDVIQALLHWTIDEYLNQEVILDWKTLVEYHYDLLQEAKEGSEEFFVQCQYLHDLFWDPTDDPKNVSVCGACVVSLLNAIDPATTSRVNESGEMVQKQDVLGYIAKELEGDDSIFLLPYSNRFPVTDATTLRLAMDYIEHVEPEDVEEFRKNLNRKYEELNCKFKISVDHPYARYAEPIMISGDGTIDYHILTESNGNPHTVGFPKEYKVVEEFYYSKYQ